MTPPVNTEGEEPKFTPHSNQPHLKLPEFYRHAPQVWFSLLEQHFNLRQVVDDDQKFSHVVVNLPEAVSTLIHDDITSPPAKDQYAHIKARLLKEFSLSEMDCAHQLLDFPGMGDFRPSQLLTKMLLLLPEDERSKPSCLFKVLYLRQLPAEVCAHLTDKTQLEIKALAEEADKFFSNNGARIQAVHTQPKAAATSAASAGRLCFYHARFGDKAKKCESPCSYRAGNE